MPKKKQNDDEVQVSARIPAAVHKRLVADFDNPNLTREIRLAVMLWASLPHEVQAEIRGNEPTAAKLEEVIQRIAGRLAGPPPASEVVAAVEARQRGRKRTSRRNSA
jgi:hypothetical protein